EIVKGGGDYLLALKDNHPTLHEAVAQAFTAALEQDQPPAEMRQHTTVEISRGRKERRIYAALPAPKSLGAAFADWVGLATLVTVIRIAEVAGVETSEVSYYLSSLPTKIRKLA